MILLILSPLVLTTSALGGVKIKAIITCAGYASRLWPLTKDTPKPLLEVKGKPIVEHIIDKIQEIPEIDSIYIVTNNKFHSNFQDWLAKKTFSLPIKILNDSTTSNEDRLGQVGDIQFTIDKENIDDNILVIAGDNLFNFSLLPAFEKFKQNKLIVNPLWESKSYKSARESGSVLINENDGSFIEFMEKSNSPKSTLLSLGIYMFPRQKLNLFKLYLDQKNNSDKMGFFMTWLMQHEKVHGHVYFEKWFDIGWIEALEQARQEFSK